MKSDMSLEEIEKEVKKLEKNKNRKGNKLKDWLSAYWWVVIIILGFIAVLIYFNHVN